MASNVINLTSKRIERADVSDAYRDFLSDMQAEYGDEAASDELALLETYTELEWLDEPAS